MIDYFDVDEWRRLGRAVRDSALNTLGITRRLELGWSVRPGRVGADAIDNGELLGAAARLLMHSLMK